LVKKNLSTTVEPSFAHSSVGGTKASFGEKRPRGENQEERCGSEPECAGAAVREEMLLIKGFLQASARPGRENHGRIKGGEDFGAATELDHATPRRGKGGTAIALWRKPFGLLRKRNFSDCQDGVRPGEKRKKGIHGGEPLVLL